MPVDDVTVEGLLGEVLAATARLTPLDVTDEGTVNDLGFRLYAVETVLLALTEKRAELVQALADTMEADRVEVPHVGVVIREWAEGSAKWDTESVRTDLRAKILDRVSLDPTQGELNPVWRGIAANTFEWIARTWGLNAPKTGRDSGLRTLGLNPDEYRTNAGGKWKVSIVGASDV